MEKRKTGAEAAPKMAGLANFRDLGGLATAEGKAVVAGRILRSDSLAFATPADLEKLEKHYRVATVVDLRTAREAARHPDFLPRRAQYVFDPVVPALVDFFPTRVKDGETNYFAALAQAIETGHVDVDELLSGSYAGYVSDPFSIAAYTRLFRLVLANEKGAVLFHCSAGKDRTGTGTALLLAVLGVRPDLIYADYLQTNANVVAQQAKALRSAAKYGRLSERTKRQIEDFLGVRPEWLDRVFKLIQARFGGIDRYATDVLRLDDSEIAKLRAMYLAPAAKAK